MQSAQYCSWHVLNAQMLVLLFGSTRLEPGQRFPTRGVIVLLTGHLECLKTFLIVTNGGGSITIIASSGLEARDAA